MKIIYLLLATLAIVSCTTKGNRGPNSGGKPKHIVITLHGVRGNAESYGDFHKIVVGNLEKIDPGFEVEVHNWTYPVGKMVEVEGHAEWTPHEISNKLNEDFFLGSNGKRPLIPSIGPQDKISFIAYSMGGLMIMSWYYDTMFNFANTPALRYSDADHQKLLGYLEKVDNVIGLGAVYWGSLDAELGWSVLADGNLKEIRKALPKLEKLCSTPEAKQIRSESTIIKDLTPSFNFFGSKPKEPTPQEKRDKVIKNSIAFACNSVDLLTNPVTAKLTNGLTSINATILKQVQNGMRAGGNMSPREMNNMRLTSESINDMRIGRIKHMVKPEYRDRFKAQWTSIVGVFPCMGKVDAGLTCSKFSSSYFEAINDGFVTLFSGAKRRETDGPVISPSAVADFLYYTELQGQEGQNISFNQFYNTMDQSKAGAVENKEIFVENMHATVAPALEALPGLLNPLGQNMSKAMLGFSDSLGTDVVIVNKECEDPKTCDHPNYKHILQALAGCEAGAARLNPLCNQDFMNQFYHVADGSQRLMENEALQGELGSFFLTLNIRLPKSFDLNSVNTDKLLQYFKFQFVNYGAGVWNENRLDQNSDPYEIQIARPSEIISSYATLKEYPSTKIMRVFFMGRMKVKAGKEQAGQKMIRAGVPVAFQVSLPGVKSRKVVAKAKATYSTYVDMFMK